MALARWQLTILLAGVLLTATGLLATWTWARRAPDRLWNDAQAALRAGRADRAEADLAWIRRLRATTTLDWLLEAQVATARGQTDRALAALGHVPEGDPLDAQAFLLAGRLERKRKRLRASEAYFQRALKGNPGLIEAHKELIYIYGIQARRPEVDAEFRALARLKPLTHHDLFTWALTHFTAWRPDVIEDLRAFIAADPDDRHSRLALAEYLADEAGWCESLDRALTPWPASDPDVLALRARSAIADGRVADAEALVAQGPEGHSGLERLRGKFALRRGEITAAAAHFRKALSVEPYDRVSTLELGQTLAPKGEGDEADALLTRAKRLNEVYNLVIRIRSPDRENEPPDLVKIADAFEAAGLVEEARHWYKLAIRRDPLDPQAQRGLYRISGRKE